MTFLRNTTITLDSSTNTILNSTFVARNGVLSFVTHHDFSPSPPPEPPVPPLYVNNILDATATIQRFEFLIPPQDGKWEFWYMSYNLQTDVDYNAIGLKAKVLVSGSFGYRANDNYNSGQVIPNPITGIKFNLNIIAICE